ncbi:MAG: degt/dnrj/eryc1/strs aminotransferase [Sphingobacteriaceae bacterium]|jgi:dTDP-4-amino-4,6-dideoxygalactose transaminase|nr:degt/dnrj/eryc1/strs aminotransferase [Sphingobacteriaceae bacterium]
MLPIPFNDLKASYLNLQAEIDAAIRRCLDSGVFINGAEVEGFCRSLASYLDVKHVLPCANGTDALQIAYMAVGLKAGDEIIIPAFGYVSAAEAAVLLGLKPVFIDVNPKTFLLDEGLLENTITSKTKAIVPIHLFGQSCNMEAILAIADKHGLYVIEDSAQSLGSYSTFSSRKKQASGTMGNIGCTSFFPTKNLGCFGDGGALFTNDDWLAERIRSIASHGQSGKYNHEEVGINSRLDAIQAAILSVKLPQLEKYNTRRLEIADFYDQQLSSIEQIERPFRTAVSSHVFHQYVILLSSGKARNGLKDHLSRSQIATQIYYPKPLHLPKAYSFLGHAAGDFPVAEEICQRCLALPIYPELSNEQIAYIADTMKDFFNERVTDPSFSGC